MFLLRVFAHICYLVVHQRRCKKRGAKINIYGHTDGRPAAVMVHYSLAMVLCLNFMIFRVSRHSCARDARVRFRAFLYSTIRIKQDIKVLRTNP